MRATRLITCLWPGLAALWWRGSLAGLVTAIGFAAMFNLAIVASFIWPEFLGSAIPGLGWLAVAAVWCVSLIRSRHFLPQEADNRGGDLDVDLFVQAQGEYLKGRWSEAQLLLEQQLAIQPGDADAILLLATLSRHSNRCEDARGYLTGLERLDAGAKWRWEIRRERQLLELIEASEPDEPQADAAAA